MDKIDSKLTQMEWFLASCMYILCVRVCLCWKNQIGTNINQVGIIYEPSTCVLNKVGTIQKTLKNYEENLKKNSVKYL